MLLCLQRNRYEHKLCDGNVFFPDISNSPISFLIRTDCSHRCLRKRKKNPITALVAMRFMAGTKHASTYCSLCRFRANQYASAKTLDVISVKMQGDRGIQPTLYTRIVKECTIPTCLRLFGRSPIHVQESLHCQQMVRSQGPIKLEVRREVFEIHTVFIERSARTRGSLGVGG